jgi:hypothetical protein
MPNGLVVRYEPKGHTYEAALASGVESQENEWTELVSVTKVLDVLDKPLGWWGMEIGVEGLLTLFNSGAVFPVQIPGRDRPVIACPALDGSGQNVVAGTDEIVKWLDQFNLTTNDVKRRAGDRGQSAHDAFEVWCHEGLMPDPSMYPEDERGYIQGLVRFLEEVPFEAEASEVVVASIEYGFAGRYDVRGRITEEARVVQRIVDKSRNLKYGTINPGSCLADLKTTKRVYTSHGKQLEAYEIAGTEVGHDPTDERYVIHITGDGLYEIVPSHATAEDFLSTFREWESSRRMAAAKSAFGKTLSKTP